MARKLRHRLHYLCTVLWKISSLKGEFIPTLRNRGINSDIWFHKGGAAQHLARDNFERLSQTFVKKLISHRTYITRNAMPTPRI